MSRKIIIATIMRPFGDTGVQTHFIAVKKYLELHQVDCRVVTPYDAPLFLVYPMFALRKLIHFFSHSASVWWYREIHAFFLKMALKKVLNEEGVIVYAQCPLSAAAALAIRGNKSVKVSMVVHFNISQADEWVGKGFIKKSSSYYAQIHKFESTTLRALDGIVYVSDFMRRCIEEKITEVAKIKHAVIPNFIAKPTFNVVERPAFSLLSIGTLEDRKNQSYALDIIKASKDLGFNFTLTLAGSGPDQAILVKKAEELQITEQLRFLGFVKNASALLPQHTACLHVAKIENLPITLIESLAYQTPIFAANVGGCAEVFIDGVHGRFLPLDNPKIAAQIIFDFLQDKKLMSALPALSLKRFEDCFAAPVVGSQLYQFLKSA